MADSKYHHGNLREALIECATTRIEEIGFDKLELRDIAALVGVSRGAPYRHFKTRNDLLAELATRGTVKLERMYARAARSEGTAKQKLTTACRMYVEFAAKHSQLYCLMSVSDLFTSQSRTPEWQAAALRAFNIHESLFAANMPSASRKAVRLEALSTWSILHGFVLLRMHDRYQPFLLQGDSEEALLEQLIRRIIAAVRQD